MTLFGIRWPEIHFIIYISEQNGHHEKLNIINKDWDHTIHPYHSSGLEGWGKTQQRDQAFYVCVCVCVYLEDNNK